jgi:hypothetical protein
VDIRQVSGVIYGLAMNPWWRFTHPCIT